MILAPTNPEDACSCGRWRNKRHCPACGCYTIYGRSTQQDMVTIDGVQKAFTVFVCRRCATTFNDTIACAAPPFQFKSAAKPITSPPTTPSEVVVQAAQQLQDMPPQDRKEYLSTLFKGAKK